MNPSFPIYIFFARISKGDKIFMKYEYDNILINDIARQMIQSK